MKRILVVDDERQMVRTLSDILRLGGWETVPAYSGEEALAAASQTFFPVVLMDIRMEGMNGVETLKALRGVSPQTRVVLMTAYTSADLMREAEREGALEILSKPVRIPALRDVLDRTLRDSHAVLVVDDEPGFLRTLSDVLRGVGYEVEAAGTLPDALHRLEERRPGVVVLDLCLDHEDPQDVVYAIKRLSPEVLLILYSGSPVTLDRVTASLPSEWVCGVLRKPFDPDRLIEMVHAALPA